MGTNHWLLRRRRQIALMHDNLVAHLYNCKLRTIFQRKKLHCVHLLLFDFDPIMLFAFEVWTIITLMGTNHWLLRRSGQLALMHDSLVAHLYSRKLRKNFQSKKFHNVHLLLFALAPIRLFSFEL